MTPLNKDALAACPFCGSGETTFDHLTHGSGQVLTVRLIHHCGHDDWPCLEFSARTKEEAIAAWNRRALRPAGEPVAWDHQWLNEWVARHDIQLPNPAYAELRTALASPIIDAKVAGPVVKALKWNGSRAESICGNYYIEANGASVWTWYLYDRSRRIGYIFATPDQAKAAAQADYEARILSALATPTAANASEGDGPNLTAYEAQVLIGTSISGCAMSPGSTFALTPAWVRLHKLGLIDRTDGLAIATEDGVKLIAAMLAAAPASPDTKEQQP